MRVYFSIDIDSAASAALAGDTQLSRSLTAENFHLQVFFTVFFCFNKNFIILIDINTVAAVLKYWHFMPNGE